MKLAAKLAQIMATVDRIPKNGRNKYHNYDYAMEADVADHVRQKFAEKNIVLIADMLDCERLERADKDGVLVSDITRVKVRFTFYDGDSEEEISFVIFGEGQDALDKGPYKALTGAVKYALMKSLLIPTGDDPENDNGQNSGTGKKEPPKKQPEKPKKETPKKEDNNSDLANEGQIKIIYAQADKNGWSGQAVEDYVMSTYKGMLISCKEEKNEVTKDMVNELLKHFKTNKPELPGDDEIPF